MLKRIIIISILLFFSISLSAGEFIGVGLHTGLQNDAGNLASLSNADYEPQQNVLIGALIKIDVRMFFIRTGADTTFKIFEGKINNNSAGKLEKINIQYTSIPVYLGINLNIRDSGKIYIGFGGAYIIGRGNVTTTAGEFTNNENVFGVGFLFGIQLRAGENTHVYVEWEYLTGRSDSVVNIHSTNTFKDYSIDYSGHRFHFGLSYYIF